MTGVQPSRKMDGHTKANGHSHILAKCATDIYIFCRVSLLIQLYTMATTPMSLST